MKTLFLVRHAKSSWASAEISDFDRPLKDRGESDAKMIASHLLEKKISPDVIISSPALRALSTAKIYAEILSYDPSEIITKDDIYFGSSFEIKNAFTNLESDINTAFIFGHNPYMTEVINDYTDDIIVNVPTSGTAHIVSEVDSWADFETKTPKMQYFYYPKMFRSEDNK